MNDSRGFDHVGTGSDGDRDGRRERGLKIQKIGEFSGAISVGEDGVGATDVSHPLNSRLALFADSPALM